MPSASTIKTYLAQVVLPVLAGAVANWLVVHLHFLASFHIGSAGVAGVLVQLGVFGITAAFSWLTAHHILKGTYAPAVVQQRRANL